MNYFTLLNVSSTSFRVIKWYIPASWRRLCWSPIYYKLHICWHWV